MSKIKDWGELTLEEKEKFQSKDCYLMETEQNVFASDKVFQKARKLMHLLQALDYRVDVHPGNPSKDEIVLEVFNDEYYLEIYVNARFIKVGNHPYTGYPYFNTYLTVGSSHLYEVVDFVFKKFE